MRTSEKPLAMAPVLSITTPKGSCRLCAKSATRAGASWLMATASVSRPRRLYLWCVATSSGISLTQLTQLVAQKLTSKTLPRSPLLDAFAPSSKV